MPLPDPQDGELLAFAHLDTPEGTRLVALAQTRHGVVPGFLEAPPNGARGAVGFRPAENPDAAELLRIIAPEPVPAAEAPAPAEPTPDDPRGLLAQRGKPAVADGGTITTRTAPTRVE